MEAKPKSVANRTSKINVELIRLGLMGKIAIDGHSLKSVFLVQAVGMNITFHLLQKKSTDVYQMVEIDHLAFPQSREEVRSLIGNFDKVVRIIDIFKMERFTIQSTQNQVRSTVRSPLLNRIVHTGFIE